MLNKKEIRKQILLSSYEVKACHIGSALSCVDILVDLFNKLKPDDWFLFSKASGVATYYCILAELGNFPKSKIAYYLKNYPLPSKEVPGVVHSFGSLGHGLSVGAGIAYANRDQKVYVLLSDGECQEGSTFEAVLFAGHHKLDNLYVIVDNNSIQALDFTRNVLKLDTMFEFMEKTLPNCEIVNTTKGDGVDFMSNNYRWHYENLTKDLLDKALKQI